MLSEREKMLSGESYDPLDPELVRARDRARDLCQDLNATREEQREERRRILRELFGAGGEEVRMQPPFFCDYGTNIRLGKRCFFNVSFGEWESIPRLSGEDFSRFARCSTTAEARTCSTTSSTTWSGLRSTANRPCAGTSPSDCAS